MIINHYHKFIFVKFPKTGSSSIEAFLSQFCEKDDLITPLLPGEEIYKKKLNLLKYQNRCYYRNSFYSKDFFKLLRLEKISIKKKFCFFDHSSLSDISKYIKKDFKDYQKITVLRNPFSLTISLFFHSLTFKKKNQLFNIEEEFDNLINNLDSHTNWYQLMITDKKNKLKIDKFLKYEKLNDEINELLNSLKIDKVKYPLKLFNFKNFPNHTTVNKKLIKVNHKEKILKCFKYIFELGKYSNEVPENLLKE